ncbi:NtrZ family periplasmic regulatory protein [Brevundimonas faecalis]|uniref:Porin n=1 Tax=Brevundimonas faecalis TaxID=947378 RepID=A0ABV2RDV2_9CAUL
MRFVALTAAIVGALALAGTAGEAVAQSRRAPAVSLTEAQASTSNLQPAPQRRGLRWNESGRWGLNFNLNQPVGRETDWGDVEAGAYYRLSPRLRVGAAANLASPEADPARAAESSDRRAQPRVRLETIFKF